LPQFRFTHPVTEQRRRDAQYPGIGVRHARYYLEVVQRLGDHVATINRFFLAQFKQPLAMDVVGGVFG
jgi:hypothetical protein